MVRPFKEVKFVTLDLLLVFVLLLVGALVLIPWGLTKRDKPEDAEVYHPRRVIVRFREGAEPVDLVKAWGGSVKKELESLDMYLVRIPAGIAPPQAVESLLAMEGVTRVEPDFLSGRGDSPEPARGGGRWGLEKINAASAWQYTQGDSDVVIAVVDTGVDSQHAKVIYRVLAGYSPLIEDPQVPIPYHDKHGRGTHITAVAAGEGWYQMTGMASGASIISVKTHDDEGRHYRADLIDGLVWLGDWARQNPGYKVVALLDGGWKYQSPFLQEAIDYLLAQGVFIVTGAGDGGDNVPYYPAAYAGVLAVGAINANDRRASFSNYGDWVSLAAPGEDIFSAVPGGGYGFSSGTAQAAAYVAGTAALIWSIRPGLSQEQVKEIILTTAWLPEDSRAFPGWRILDTGKALEYTVGLDD